MGTRAHQTIQRLLARARRALDEQPAGPRTIEHLVALARAAEHGTDAWVFAYRHLAERVAPTEPWRASLMARAVLARRPHDHRAWGALGLAQSLLGNPRFATHAYRQALAFRPDDPAYAHNLGHLYDAILDDPARGLPWLRLAWRRLPDHPDVVASYAHALARAGDAPLARVLLGTVVQRGATAEQLALYRWVQEHCPDAGASMAASPLRLQRRRRKRRRTRTSA